MWRLVKFRHNHMQQSTACLHFAWRTTSLRVGGQAARRSCLPCLRRGGGGRQAGATVLSCLVCRCEVDDCSERVQTSNFLSATVLSCRQSNSHLRRGHDTDKTVLFCLAWRCELAVIEGQWMTRSRGITKIANVFFNLRTT